MKSRTTEVSPTSDNVMTTNRTTKKEGNEDDGTTKRGMDAEREDKSNQRNEELLWHEKMGMRNERNMRKRERKGEHQDSDTGDKT